MLRCVFSQTAQSTFLTARTDCPSVKADDSILPNCSFHFYNGVFWFLISQSRRFHCLRFSCDSGCPQRLPPTTQLRPNTLASRHWSKPQKPMKKRDFQSFFYWVNIGWIFDRLLECVSFSFCVWPVESGAGGCPEISWHCIGFFSGLEWPPFWLIRDAISASVVFCECHSTRSYNY
jgi:hypothetical protein